MNKLISFIAIVFALLSVSCSHDDEPAFDNKDLLHTTWKGNDVCYENGEEIASTQFIVEFLTESEGRYIDCDEDGNPTGDGHFKYNIDGDMITFNGAIEGNWTIIERTKNAITLRAFRPKEHKIFLNRFTS